MIRRLSCVAFWLLFLAATLISPGSSVAADQSCSDNWCWRLLPDSPSYPDTYAYNNLWNTRGARGKQSITVYDGSPGDPGIWSTTLDWNRSQQWTVTSFVSTVNGWHWGEPFDTWELLPVPVSQLVPGRQSVNTSVKYVYQPDPTCGSKRVICRYDVAYDLWFHDHDPTGTGDAPNFELMVWLSYSRADLFVGYQSVIQPLPYVGGHHWNVFQTTSTNAVFVIADVDQNGNPVDVNGDLLNLAEFINLAKTLNSGLSSWYLTGVEFGIEVYKGKGTFTVTDYQLAIGPDGSP